MPTIRKLTAVFRFQVDTTPADRFNAAVNRSKNNLKSLAGINLSRFGHELKRAFQFGIAGAVAAIGAGIVASLKFGDIKQALSLLEFQFKGSFQPLRNEISAILADPLIGKLTNELELLNAAAVAAGEGIDRSFIIRNLSSILAFSKQFKLNLGEATTLFVDFLRTGNLDILLKTGKITAEQARFLQAAGIGPQREGIKAREIRLEKLLAEITPDIRQNIEKMIQEGAFAQEILFKAFNKLALEIGERTLPAFRDLSIIITSFTEDLIKLIRGEITFRELVTSEKAKEAFERARILDKERKPVITAVPGEITAEATELQKGIEEYWKKFLKKQELVAPGERFKNIGKKFLEDIGFFKKPKKEPEIIIPFSGVTNRTTSTSSQTVNNIEVNVNVGAGATADTNQIKTVIRDELSQIMGRSAERSRNATLIRGTGQVVQ